MWAAGLTMRSVPSLIWPVSLLARLSAAYSAEIATDSEANRHAFRRKSAVREVGAKRRWDFVHSLRVVWVASHVDHFLVFLIDSPFSSIL